MNLIFRGETSLKEKEKSSEKYAQARKELCQTGAE